MTHARLSRSTGAGSRGATSRGGTRRPSPSAPSGPAPAPGPGPAAHGLGPTAADVSGLQSTIGNAAVVGYLREIGAPDAGGLPIQRTEIAYDDPGETLYNQTPARDPSVTPGTAGSKHYGMGSVAAGRGIRYDMVRSGSSVTVTVKIKFVDAARNVNAMTGGTAIAEGDERREFGQRMCDRTTTHWNGRLIFVGQDTPPPEPGVSAGVPMPKDVRLPVTFRAEPVWDVAATAHKTVRLFGSATVADPLTGHPIDAGNFYMNTGEYGASAEAIYAHEYGHLIGLQDEYSQSNFQMHRLLHQISPTLGGERGAALDRASVERMVLAALTRPLYFRLASTGRELSHVFRAERKPLEDGLIAALNDAANSSSMRVALGVLLAGQAPPRLHAQVAKVVEFQLGRGFGGAALGRSTIGREFAARQLGDTVASQYYDALLAVHGTKADVGGGPSGQIAIRIHGGAEEGTGIWGAADSGALAANARAIAGNTVGAAGSRSGIPPVRPSASMIAKIEEIPAVWAAAAASGGSAVGATGVLTKMLGSAASGALGAGAITSGRALWTTTRRIVQAAAREAASETVRGMLSDQLTPIFAAHVTALQADVRDEVARVMSTPAAGVAAAAPKDADIAAMVAAMQTRLAAQTPAGRTDTNPARPGVAATEPAAGSQEVTYSNTGIMSDNSADMRPDQFVTIVGQFNDVRNGFRKDTETEFSAEIRR